MAATNPSPAANPLDTLRDIRLPPPPDGLPDWVLLALAAFTFLSALLLITALLRRRSPARRAMGARIDGAMRLPGEAGVAALAHLLRDEASRSGGTAAAALSGDAWLRWLDQHFATDFFTRGEGRIFGDALYAPGVSADRDALTKGVLRALTGPWWRPW
ncbi:MAG: DUF4381 domain-containing protein [Notoacmeibacter sp.]|nr:DUF4381 domain-containing protein [Notoacmeibacter sp.]MCC0031931.1 DUF4381 domain-containing protein [Brucellaceae bacterium]